MTDLKALRAAAEAATPGPWESSPHGLTVDAVHENARNFSGKLPVAYPSGYFGTNAQQRANADFIAAFNPTVILELLDRLERAEAKQPDSERDAALLDFLCHTGAGVRRDPDGKGFFLDAPYYTGISAVDDHWRFRSPREAIDVAMTAQQQKTTP